MHLQEWKTKILTKWKIIGSKKMICAIAATGTLLFLLGIVLIVQLNKEESVYRETTVIKGNLTVGVTESGNANIGSTKQTFDIDISEYTGSSSDILTQSTTQMPEGMAQMFQSITSSSTSSSDTSRALEVETVYAAAGQEVEKGEALLKLTDSSVNEIKEKLEEDEANAKLTYDQILTSQKQIQLQSTGDFNSNQAYGTYAEAEYTKTVNDLQREVEDIQEKLQDANEELSEKTKEAEELQLLLTKQQTVLENADYAKTNTDRDENLYWWIVAVNTVSDTKDMEETTKDNIETITEEIAQLNLDITSYNTELALAQKSLESGKEEGEIQKEQRLFQSDNAQEIYDVAVEQNDFDTQVAKTDYENSKQKLEDFNSLITDGVLVSQYSGIITEVGLAQGDGLEEGSLIITVNNYEEAQITLSVEEEDMDSAKLGNEVNITFPAFTENTFKGKVTEVGDAQINSNTNTTSYSVTVTVIGDFAGLYEGMSAEVTFITKETEEVLYVSNRAILREGTDSYVKIKDTNGSIVKKKVSTGFSDGINVEIKEGLSEGDIVLIESGLQSNM